MAITKKIGPGPKKKTQSFSDLVKAGKVDVNYVYQKAKAKKQAESNSLSGQLKNMAKQTLAAGYGMNTKTTKSSTSKTTSKPKDVMKSALAQGNTKKKTNNSSLSSKVWGAVKKGYGMR